VNLTIKGATDFGEASFDLAFGTNALGYTQITSTEIEAYITSGTYTPLVLTGFVDLLDDEEVILRALSIKPDTPSGFLTIASTIGAVAMHMQEV
jgi:hypothetical protein